MENNKANKIKKWYAIYTKSRNEKKLATNLAARGIEVYLPLLKTLKQWSDRKKWVEIPLFRSYLFVHIFETDYLEVLQTDGVVRFVTFRKEKIPIPESQILAVKSYLEEDNPILMENLVYLPGDRVEISRGPLRGLLGVLVEVKGKQRVMVEIESIGQRLILNLPKSIISARS